MYQPKFSFFAILSELKKNFNYFLLQLLYTRANLRSTSIFTSIILHLENFFTKDKYDAIIYTNRRSHVFATTVNFLYSFKIEFSVVRLMSFRVLFLSCEIRSCLGNKHDKKSVPLSEEMRLDSVVALRANVLANSRFVSTTKLILTFASILVFHPPFPFERVE